MTKNTKFTAPADISIENKSQKEIKIPVAGSPDQFIQIEAGATITVTAATAAQVAFYVKLEELFPVAVTVA